MTTTITDPSLQVFSAEATDQLLMWRTDANLPLGGRTVTIAVSDFFLSMASSWMTMWFAALPTTAPEQGWWRNGTELAYAGDPTTAPALPGGMTTEQFAAVRNAYLASLPTTDPGDGVSDWNNFGVITKSIKSGT
ncbi:hypothetical protein [Gluconobacter oxydans]|uniref:hypothetical protein n=1 Tax=Gluconobacter oxydans TaxID=442 RepID=UPI0039ECBB1E